MAARQDWVDVLVVDDNTDVRVSFATILRHAGFTVDEVGDGRSAVQRIRSGEVGVVVLDMQMPILDGPGVLLELGDEAPIVVLVTADDIDDAYLFSISPKVVGYLRKPVPPVHLRAVVADALAARAGRVRASARAASDELSWVRDELKSLNQLRMTGGLTPAEEAHYRGLIATERILLSGGR